jgi:hypothetical protein
MGKRKVSKHSRKVMRRKNTCRRKTNSKKYKGGGVNTAEIKKQCTDKNPVHFSEFGIYNTCRCFIVMSQAGTSGYPGMQDQEPKYSVILDGITLKLDI